MASAAEPGSAATGALESRLAGMAGRTGAALAPRATTGLFAALRALDLPPGSEVLLPATLCANPAQAVLLAGLRPLFADVLPGSFGLDLPSAERLVGPRTRVLLAVPLFGHPLAVPLLLDFAARHGLVVVEDAAQALGQTHGDRPAGSVGACSVFSFGGGKIAGAGGGAAVLSDDHGLLERVRLILDALPSARRDRKAEAARISAALDGLPAELQGRCAMAGVYSDALEMAGVERPDEGALWKYSVLVPERMRDLLVRELLAAGVDATTLYPPLSLFFRGARPGGPASLPQAFDLHRRVINLPLWPHDPTTVERARVAFARIMGD
jgi:perosamine synthetase